MKIKRYTAESMRAALAQVRAEQGPDAVILSSRRGPEGIEVIAAVDYDEALFTDANRQRVAAAAEAAAQPPAKAHAPAPARAAAPSAAVVTPAQPVRKAVPVLTPALAERGAAMPKLKPAPTRRTDMGYALIEREMHEMRRLLETGMAGQSWSDKRRRDPLKARVLERLSDMDIAPDVAMALAERSPRRTNIENTDNIPLALLVKHLPTCIDTTADTAASPPSWDPRGPARPRPSPSWPRVGVSSTAPRTWL